MSQTASPETSIVQGDPRFTNTQPAPDETLSTTTSLSTHWKLHLSVTPTDENRTLSTSSREWRTLRTKILFRDNWKLTCSSCGYLFPYPHGRSMVIDHKDGNASNNDPSNLRVHCPPCDSIRDCGSAGLQNSLIVAESSMEQVEIIHKTREMFEKRGVILHPKRIDPSVKPADISVMDLANMLSETPWKDLPEKFQRLRGFFTKHSSPLFLDPMLPKDLDPDPEEGYHWKLHLSVTTTHGNRTLPTLSPEWKALRNEILLRDNRTCSSCGYVSPYPNGRQMVVDHKDGDASNNDPSNLRVHCPPCDSIRHCGFAGSQGWLIVAESAMEQVEIVRKTREMFEKSGVIPHPEHVDPWLRPTDIYVGEVAGMMMVKPWKYLPEKFKRLRGFFTKESSRRFLDTMLPRGPDTEKSNDDSTEALFNKSDRKAVLCETSPPWIRYSEELHESSQVFLDSWLPSKTLNTQAAWICVDNPRSTKLEYESPDLDALSSVWDKICAKRRPTLLEVDKLAKQFNFFSGKWHIFFSSDKVDNPWRQIAKSTLAGTLGHSAIVSPRGEEDPAYGHVISVYNSDYRSIAEVNRVREELRRLGVKWPIAYKPDIYEHCGIYPGNRWGIPASLYQN